MQVEGRAAPTADASLAAAAAAADTTLPSAPTVAPRQLHDRSRAQDHGVRQGEQRLGEELWQEQQGDHSEWGQPDHAARPESV